MGSAIKRINEYNSGIAGELHDLKWKALKESSFRFFRGTCHLFAEDFVKIYKYKPKVKAWISEICISKISDPIRARIDWFIPFRH